MVSWLRSGCAVAVAAVLCGGIAQAQTVDEIVAKNLQARGGIDKLKAMTTAKITGDVDQRGTKIHIVTWAKRPNSMRREMEATPPPPSPGRASIPASIGPIKVVVAFDGNTVWMINPLQAAGPQAITGPQADMAKGDADFDSVLLDYKEKGTKIELVGTQPIDDKPAYHLKLTKKTGLVQDYYIDVATGLETRTATTMVGENGAKTELTTDLLNYQTVDGLTMPFTMRQSVNGEKVAEVTISKWEVNVPVEDDLFKMPAK